MNAVVPVFPVWVLLALTKVGTHERRGGEDPEIMEFHRVAETGQDEDEDAWCGAFMGWTMVGAGHGKPKGAGAARSWLTWGEPCECRVGAVVVFWRVSPDGWQGHVALVVRDHGDVLEVLGGNQGDKVCIATMPKSQVLGYRWPAGVPR